MNKYQINKRNSFVTTDEVMMRNESIWKDSEPISQVLTSIRENLLKIGDFHQQQDGDRATDTLIKKNLKSQMVQHVEKVLSYIRAHAVETNNISLGQSVAIKDYELMKMPQNNLIDKVKQFYSIASGVQPSVKNLDIAEVEKMNTLLSAYSESLAKPAADTSESKTATKNLQATFETLNTLYGKLDILMGPYRYTQPSFYSDYMNSRIVKDLTGKRTKEENSPSTSTEASRTT